MQIVPSNSLSNSNIEYINNQSSEAEKAQTAITAKENTVNDNQNAQSKLVRNSIDSAMRDYADYDTGGKSPTSRFTGNQDLFTFAYQDGNDQVSLQWNGCGDKPTLMYYNSADNEIITQASSLDEIVAHMPQAAQNEFNTLFDNAPSSNTAPGNNTTETTDPAVNDNSTQTTNSGCDNNSIDTPVTDSATDNDSTLIDNTDQDGVSVTDGNTDNQPGDYGDNSGYNNWTGGVGNGYLWRDGDGDGDADMTLVVGQGIDRSVADQAAKQLEDGSGGKLDVHLVDQPPSDGRDYGTLTSEPLGGYLAGLSTVGSGAEVQIDTQYVSSLNTVTHELMHAAGVTEDGRANGGDSIMDYSYRGTNLTQFDKGLLQNLYGNMTAGTNT